LIATIRRIYRMMRAKCIAKAFYPDLIMRSIAKQCVSKDGVATDRAALVLRDAAFGRSSG